MKIVVDANIIFACILRNGATRRLILNPELELIAPEFIVKEFAKYANELKAKYTGADPAFDKIVEDILSIIKLIPDEELQPYLPAAKHLITDEKDLLYLACALNQNAVIWTNDKEYKKQTRITIKTTSELLKEVGELKNKP